jgi:hypothetical protein
VGIFVLSDTMPEMKLNRIRFFLILTAFALFPVTRAFSQGLFNYAVGGGIMYYNGDLSDSRPLPPLELMRGYFSADISMLLVDRLDLSLHYLHGNIAGDDALSNENDNKVRNQSFFSPIDEVKLMLRLKAFSVKSRLIVNPYAMAGIGYFWFNPQAELDGKIYELQPLGTEGQFIEGGGYPAPYSLSSGSFALGLGVQIRLNHNFALRIEGAPQLTFTDYLDDTSFKYPDSTALAATPKGSVAVLFASRREKGFPDGGRFRGNPDKDDVMVTLGMSLVFTPGSRECKAIPRPGIIRQVFKGRKGWWGMTPN